MAQPLISRSVILIPVTLRGVGGGWGGGGLGWGGGQFSEVYQKYWFDYILERTIVSSSCQIHQ